MLSGGKKKASLEIDAGDSFTRPSPPPASATPAATASGGEDDVPELSLGARNRRKEQLVDVPYWLHVLHYVLHSLFLLIVMLLIIAIAMVETDAKDANDGAVNSVLKAFNLNIDGAVSEGGFSCAGGGGAGAAMGKAMEQNSIAFVNAFFKDKRDLSELEDYVDEKSFVNLSMQGRLTLGEYKELFQDYPVASDTQVAIDSTVNGNRVILRVKTVSAESTSTYLTSTDCDPRTGRIVRRLVYPSLETESMRLATAQVITNVIMGKSDAVVLDSLRFSDDFRAYWSGGIMDKATLQAALVSYADPTLAASFEFSNHYFVSGARVINRLDTFEPGSESLTSVSIFDFSFRGDSLASLRYTESIVSTWMGQAVLAFEEAFSDFKYQRWDDIVSPGEFQYHASAKLYNLEELKELAKRGEDFRRKNQLSLPRRVFPSVLDPMMIYSMWSRGGRSGVKIFKLDSASKKIRYVYSFSTVDIKSMVAAVDAFENMRSYALALEPYADGDGAALLEAFDALNVTDDFIVSWGRGDQTRSEFRDTLTAIRSENQAGVSDYDGATFYPITKIISNNICISHGFWMDDTDAADISNTGVPTTTRSNAEVFYFDPSAPLDNPRLQSAYLYRLGFDDPL